MDKPMKNSHFRMMSAMFRMRDKFTSPRIKVEKADIKPGQVVLDYGCGPGSYAVEAAELVGDTGKVYAADIHPLSPKKVQAAASKKGLNNIETILIDGATNATGLSDKYVDVILSFDMFQQVSDKELLLKEWHRVLKKKGDFGFRFSSHGRKRYSLAHHGRWTVQIRRTERENVHLCKTSGLKNKSGAP